MRSVDSVLSGTSTGPSCSSYCSDTCCSITVASASRCSGWARSGPLVIRTSAREDREDELAETEVQQRDDRDHHEHEDHDDEEVGDQLLLGRVDDLAELGDHLAVERGRCSCVPRSPSRAGRGRLCCPTRCSPRPGRLSRLAVDLLCLQGTRDLNPQPSVLETDALPVELVPSDGLPRAACRAVSGHAEAWGKPPRRESTHVTVGPPKAPTAAAHTLATCAEGPPFSPEGAPAPALHRVDAARDAARARRSATASTCPTSLVSEWPPQLTRGRREGLVPLPAPLRRRAVGAPHRGRRTTPGARGRRGRRRATAARWLEIQVDPSGYAARFGGITAFTDLVLDAVRDASATAPASGWPS